MTGGIVPTSPVIPSNNLPVLPALKSYLSSHDSSQVIGQNPLLFRQQVSRLRGMYASTPNNLKVVYSVVLLVPYLLLKKTILRSKPPKWNPDWVRRKPRRWMR